MKAALFDLDGVVLDTESQYTVFWQEIGKQRFPDVTDFARRVKGVTLKEITAQYFNGNEEDKRNIQQRLDEFELQMNYPYISGARNFLLRLKAEGIKTALVTSSNKAKMDNVYKNVPEITSLFDKIFTAEDTPASKPAPDCYIIAAQAFGARPEECVVFEDSRNGLKAGRGSGAVVVGLSTSLPEDVIRPLCDVAIPDFSNPEDIEHILTL